MRHAIHLKKKRRRENLLGSKEELEGYEIRSLKE